MKFLISVVLSLFSVLAHADLTTAQMQTLKSACSADQTCNAYIVSPSYDNDILLAAWLNAPGSCVAWRTAIQPAEYREAIVWTAVDALAAGKARIWEWITANMTLPIDASKSNVRQGIQDAWGSGSATSTALVALAKRTGNRAESALATGTCTTGNPGVLIFEGQVSQAQASTIRSLQ